MKLVVSNDKPVKPNKIIYCPECQGSTWIYVNIGRAEPVRPVRKRCCIKCLAKGIETIY